MSSQAERTLVLVRHAESAPRCDRPAAEWALTDAGRALAAAVAERLRPHAPGLCASSPEPRALDTARIIADALGIGLRAVDGLREQARRTAPFYPDVREFRAAVEALFVRPDEVVFGEESGRACEARIAASLESVMVSGPTSVVAVTHGTAMSLWLGPRLGRPPADVWRALGWGAFAALRWPSGAVIEWFAGA